MELGIGEFHFLKLQNDDKAGFLCRELGEGDLGSFSERLTANNSEESGQLVSRNHLRRFWLGKVTLLADSHCASTDAKFAKSGSGERWCEGLAASLIAGFG